MTSKPMLVVVMARRANELSNRQTENEYIFLTTKGPLERFSWGNRRRRRMRWDECG